MKNLLYRLLSLGLSLASGVLAGAMFKGVWKLIARKDDAPQAPIRSGAGRGSCPPRLFKVRSLQQSRPPRSVAPRRAAASWPGPVRAG
jgi:hypothetical protein